MNIAELSLKRPVFAIVCSIVIMVFGAVSYKFLSLREYPAIDPPNITIRTNYTGANSDIIESQITEPLEKAVNGIQGIRTITSSSNQGSSSITVEFNLDVDLETAANDVRDKVSQATRNLPADIDAPPVVSKADASGDVIIILAIQSREKTILELNDFAENVLQEKFQTIQDVSGVNIFGQRRYAMRLDYRPDRMSAYGITVADVRTALDRENIELPGGKIYGDKTELTVKTQGRLVSENDFRQLILKEDANGIVRLGDVADVRLGSEQEEVGFRLNGIPNVALGIAPQPGANYVKISDEFYKRLDEVKKIKGFEDIEFTVVLDNTRNVRRAITEVEETLIVALILVVLVVFAFFRNWSIAFRPLIDIPVSLIGAFFIMYVAGFSINVLTLLAIVLATGLVVDDGIVVTENIFRKLEEGMNIKDAAREGSKEIIFAVISTSITLAVVFLPIIFIQGFVGSLFREFGIVIAGAVLISAFVSLTLTPVLNVLLNRKNSGHSKFYTMTEPFFNGLENGYRGLLGRFMKVKSVSVVILLVCFAAIVFLFKNLQSELAPMEDKSQFRFSATAPEGTSFDYMDKFTQDLGDYFYDSIPERSFVFASTNNSFANGSVNSAFGRIVLVDPEERTRTQEQIVTATQSQLSRFNDSRVFLVQEQTISVGFGNRGALPVQFVLQTQNFDKLKEVLPKFLAEARKEKTFQVVDANLKFNKPELEISIDRIKAKDLGLSVQDVAQTLQSALSGGRLGYFIMNGKQYQIIGQMTRNDRDQPSDLGLFYVRNNRGELIQLSSVVNMVESSSPPQLFHYNRYKSATVSASLAPGKTIGDGVTAMNNIASKLLDESFQTSLTGPSRDYAESSSNTSFAFLLALVLIYLVLSAQFESFIDPFTIMITVPLALAGALLSLWLTGNTINIFSQIGMIMLVGLVTKNGILIVEFANKKREEGEAKLQAIMDASVQRMRPILMTSLATALGALPIALSLGAAATSRIPLGVVIVGGIVFSLILTLFVIPAIYIIFQEMKDWFRNRKNRKTEMKHLILLPALWLSSMANAQQTITLQEAITTALKNNLDLQVSANDAEIAHNNNNSGMAGMLPSVTFNAGTTPALTNINQKFTNGTSIEKNGVFSNAISGSLVVAYTLYDGSRMFATRNRLEFQDEAAKNAFNSNVQTIVSGVINVYTNIVRQEDYMKVLNQLEVLSNERLKLVEQRQAVGLANNSDLYLARLDHDSRLQSIQSQELMIRNLYTDLTVLLNLAPDTRFKLNPVSIVNQPVSRSMLDTAMKRNPALALAQSQLDIAMQTQREISAASMPVVRLNGSYNYNLSQSQAGFSLYNQSTGPQVGLSLSMPLFTGNVNKTNTKNARVNVESASLRKEKVLQQLKASFEQAWASYETAMAQVKADSISVETAKSYMDLMQQRFALGQNTIIDLKEAQRTFEETNYRLISNTYILRLAETQLLLLSGRLVDFN